MNRPPASVEGSALDLLLRGFEAHRRGALCEAAALYEAVLRLQPDDPDALHLLGVARRALGRPAEAASLVRRAIERAPGLAAAWYNLGNIETDRGRQEEAAAAYERAAELDPDNATYWYALGVALARTGRSAQAMAAYRRALACDPHHLAARHNLANQLLEHEQDHEAVRAYRAVLARAPELPEAHYNLARALLRLGDWTTGFAEYRWRWRVQGFTDRPRRPEIPLWQGEPVRGRTVLVQAEQGLGDTIQFVRLVPMLAALGARVHLEVAARLVPLLETVTGVERVVPIDRAAPDAQFRAPLLDLPYLLGLTLGSMPSAVPYLRAEAARIRSWRERLRRDGRTVVGVCWRGNPHGAIDRGRSLPDPAPLARALAHERIRLVALTEPAAHPVEPLEGGLGWKLAGCEPVIEHPGPDLDAVGAFLDTAALLQSVDLVVTTDTALAHLAGALARPTWVLLRHAADWRWLRDRNDSPFYPTMRLFRQRQPGDWSTPLAEVRVALAARLASRSEGHLAAA